MQVYIVHNNVNTPASVKKQRCTTSNK